MEFKEQVNSISWIDQLKENIFQNSIENNQPVSCPIQSIFFEIIAFKFIHYRGISFSAIHTVEIIPVNYELEKSWDFKPIDPGFFKDKVVEPLSALRKNRKDCYIQLVISVVIQNKNSAIKFQWQPVS